ncbi:MAG: hypothetical protein RLZZ303_3061 [Candidatus Hydrogenedentota bacterium]
MQAAAEQNPRSIGEKAPSAAEMEGALGIGAAPATVDSGSLRIEIDAPAQNGTRPQAPLPPITANPSPFVDEAAVIPTKDLHGYAFPGVNEVEPAKVAKVETTPPAEQARMDEAEIERRAQARAEELAQRKAELMAEGLAEERAKALVEELNQKRSEEIEQLRKQLEADGLERRKAEGMAQELSAKRIDELAQAKAGMIAKGLAEERAREMAEQMAQARAEELAQAKAELIAEGLAEEKAQAMAEKMAESRAKILADEIVEQRMTQLEAAEAAEPAPITDWQPAGDLMATTMGGPYQIGAGDILEFQSFSDPTLNRELTVRYDGHISLPLIEDINVSGQTREEAESLIQQAYTAVFKNPQMSLLVRETASKTFAVIGDIEQPGVYPYLRPTTLIEAVSLAGGLRRRNSSSSVGGFVGVTGQLTKAFVIRHHQGERLVFQYDLRQLGTPGAHAGDAPIYYGDLIYVPEGVNLIYLLGESRNPVIVELTEGMTLLQMLSLSGGFNQSTARLRNVVLMRQADGENTRVLNVNVREMLRTGNDFPLAPGDIIYIPQKWTVRLSEFVARFTGSISPVLDMYNNAVQAYYGADLARNTLRGDDESRTLRRLVEIEQFGTSTQNIYDLFGAP